MAAGKPIVTTDLPSVREIVGDEDVFFAGPDGSASIAGAIARAIATPHEKTARTLALAQKWNWQARAGQILAFITACS